MADAPYVCRSSYGKRKVGGRRIAALASASKSTASGASSASASSSTAGAFHHTRQAFETDRERDRVLQAAHWRPIRVTSRQVDQSRNDLERDLRRMLGLSAFTLAA
jgi:hypothetical protein